MQHGDNFTERGRRALAMAREEAVRLRHEYTGTEHLLLGLLREEKGLAAQVLNGAGVTVETARVEMQRILGTSPLDGDASRLDRSSSGADEMGRMVVNGMRAFLAPRGDRPRRARSSSSFGTPTEGAIAANAARPPRRWRSCWGIETTRKHPSTATPTRD
jgi:hypothetical protein